jgi:biopolymer transport protein ExbD
MARGTKKFVVKPAQALNSDINVTPLVDVVLVLLIIFMVVTPLLEKDIAVRVPETEKVETVVDVPKNQLMVRVGPEGDLKLSTGQAEFKVEQAELIDKLKEIIDRRRKPEDKIVFVVADDKANYGGVISVLDAAKQAGATVLGMMTELPEDAAGQAPAPPPPQ